MSQDLHTLAGPYALNALSGAELRRFEEHLAHCDSCRSEVRGLTETTALLGAAAARTPPPGLRRRVLEQVARTRQLAPDTGSAPRGLLRRRGWSLALAACLVLILGLGGVVAEQQRRLDEMRDAEHEIAAVLTAPDAVRIQTEPAEGMSVTVVASDSMDRVVFSARGMERMDDGDYQLWLTEDDGTMHSVGVLSVAPDGMVGPVLTESMADAAEVAVTIEPTGGSERPTADPMLAMPIED